MPDETIDFKASSLTLDECARIQDLAGRPVGEVLTGLMRGKFTAQDLRAIAVVMKQRRDPDFAADDLDGDTNVAGLLVDAVTSGMLADVGGPDGA